MIYEVQQQLKPSGLKGISDDQIAQHWVLYEGYVNNFNGLCEQLERSESGSREFMELKRRAGFEFDGMALHELYFGNLAAGVDLNDSSQLTQALAETWGSLNAWKADMVNTALMRGIGWALLYHDATADRLFNWWVSDHELNQPAGLNPILALDVWEHAYMVDQGAAGRGAYVEAFFENVHWTRVEERFAQSRAGKVVRRF